MDPPSTISRRSPTGGILCAIGAGLVLSTWLYGESSGLEFKYPFRIFGYVVLFVGLIVANRRPTGDKGSWSMTKRARILLCVLAFLAAAGEVVAWQWKAIDRAYWNYCVEKVTKGLPESDRVEVFHLDDSLNGDEATGFPIKPYGVYAKIIDRKTLSGADAQALAAAWRSMTFENIYAQCHYPAYGFRFYRGSSLKFETSVCFGCSNFYVTFLGESYWRGFGAKEPGGEALLKRLQEVFPASIPVPKSE